MHADETTIDENVVHQLLSSQFPQWANLPIQFLETGGTENAIYRLGDEMAIRLPRIASAAPNIEKEYEWLPKLASSISLAIPGPLAKGLPTEDYAFPWYIYKWLDGKNAANEPITDFDQAASDLGNFIAALHKLDTTNAPRAERGGSLKRLRDAATRAAITELEGVIDTDLAIKAWDRAILTPEWRGTPLWIHGDLHAGNVLVENGKLSAIIDFGGMGIGDPACDLMAAWTLLNAETRQKFRTITQVDDDTWERGRGWALTMGLVALPYYKDTNPEFARIARHAIDEVLEEIKI